MGDRLKEKVAIVVGAGQTPGDTIGNGRAISILFAREGASLILADKNLDSGKETQSMIEKEGGDAFAVEIDITREDDCKTLANLCVERYGSIDILVNNVGHGQGDAGPVKLTEEAWDSIYNANIKGMFLTCKHVLPIMEAQEKGSIINISSIASVCAANMLAYKTSKAAVNALTHAIAMQYGKKGIRVNTVMPGLLKTPISIEDISWALGVDKDELIRRRDKTVPLKGGTGDAWDTAYAVLFLASDEAKFITSVTLAVDGGQSARIG